VEGTAFHSDLTGYASGSKATGKALLARKAAVNGARLRVSQCKSTSNKAATPPLDLPCDRLVT